MKFAGARLFYPVCYHDQTNTRKGNQMLATAIQDHSPHALEF
jgi:hypothetical protein